VGTEVRAGVAVDEPPPADARNTPEPRRTSAPPPPPLLPFVSPVLLLPGVA
jgi:hypothetical protein